MIKKLLKEKMLIGGWVTPWPKKIMGKDYITEETYRQVKDCGIDFLHTLYEKGDDGDFLQALDSAEKAGVYLYIHDDRFFKGEFTLEEGRKWIKELSKRKSFLGVNVKDEPCSNDFENLKNIVEQYSSDSEIYINLLPVYAIGTQLVDGIWLNGKEATEEEYENYLEKFLNTVPVNVLSYDFYPFKDLTYGSLDKRYFYQLHISKKLADEKNLPLWNFVQVTAFNDEVRIMSDAEIWWCVTTSVAFGVTCLQYFTYFTPVDSAMEKFKGAIIDENGNTTERYECVRKCNAHLNALGNRLIDARFDGVMACGEYSDLIPKERILDGYGNIEKVVGKDYLIGCFEKNGKKLYYAVNPSLSCESEITLTFDNLNEREVIDDDKLERKEIKTLTIKLLPGRAVLIV